MPISTRLKTNAAAATAEDIDITWTANEPTAGTSQTIADGDTPTVAETGQFIANQAALNAKLIADIAEIRSKFND